VETEGDVNVVVVAGAPAPALPAAGAPAAGGPLVGGALGVPSAEAVLDVAVWTGGVMRGGSDAIAGQALQHATDTAATAPISVGMRRRGRMRLTEAPSQVISGVFDPWGPDMANRSRIAPRNGRS
jgi:hypothetical protein